jgi:hypothetical protein
MRLWTCLAPVLALAGMAFADGPADNIPDKVRRIPPPGIKIADEVRADLQKRCDALEKTIDELRTRLKENQLHLALLPDVQIFHKAVHDALKYDEFYNPAEATIATKLLDAGEERAHQLREGKPGWVRQTGLVVRGYVSKIDGSVQPYGLVVPASFKEEPAKQPHRYRLDFWCHGRGEKLTELAFIDQRMKSPGEFTPAETIVLHLYGRYCCANKFAGEVDLFEAYDSVRKRYPIDENRLVIRGFSMGGAACWQFAVHYPGMWAAAAPGAGFSETPDFLKVFQKETLEPTWYEKKLWHLYDCTDYAVNLFNCPTIAYSGEIDSQKQAADMMEKAMKAEGLTLTHLIGKKTAHSYEPTAKAEINRLVDTIVSGGRVRNPTRVRFATWTLRYNRSHWVQINGMGEHWERAYVDARVVEPTLVKIQTTNVTGLTLDMAAGSRPIKEEGEIRVEIDGKVLKSATRGSGKPWKAHFVKGGDVWRHSAGEQQGELAKRHGLQGPIDDAFWDRFVMVRPTGKPLNEKVGTWAEEERKHATEHWRRQFRGEAIVKDDADITEDDIASSNLVLWGDPASNKVLAKIVDRLPIRWSDKEIRVGEKSFDSEKHVLLMICPNPLNPAKYVVLNSGFTFREYDYLNNARQVPKLPDYAVVDVSVPVSSRSPGGVVAADFLGEDWQLRAGKR